MLPSTLTVPILLLLALIFILSAIILSPKRRKNGRKQPPGPPALPVIGNLHLLGKLPHRDLHSLAKKYGSIMYLRFGQTPAIVVSSPEAAELFLRSNDPLFASRPKFQATEYITYGSKGLVFAEYGPYWRNMRKLCTVHLLTTSKVEMFAPMRREELGLAVKSVEKAAAAHEVVDLSELVENLIENIVYKMVLGCCKDDRFDLKRLVQEGMYYSGAFNISDYVPSLAPLDLQGLIGKFKRIGKALDEVLENIIKEHEKGLKVKKVQHQEDFVDILLSLMHEPIDESHLIDRTSIKAIVLDMIAGAFETTSTVIEWALSELLRNPRVMKNLQDELLNVVGMKRMAEEADLSKLDYLNNVLKETLRLHPAGAISIRESTQDAVVGGYDIEKKSRILINIWAIGRDVKAWSENAELYYPERFAGSDIDFRGHDFELVPFGSGRRICPGMNLALASVKFAVAQLVHCFNWELPKGISPSDLDMTEKFGLSMPRATHLLAVPAPRLLAQAHI